MWNNMLRLFVRVAQSHKKFILRVVMQVEPRNYADAEPGPTSNSHEAGLVCDEEPVVIPPYEDVDARDLGNPQMVVPYVRDIMERLKEREVCRLLFSMLHKLDHR